MPVCTNCVLVAGLLLWWFWAELFALCLIDYRRDTVCDYLFTKDFSRLHPFAATRFGTVAPRVGDPLGFAGDLTAGLRRSWFVIDIAEGTIRWF